MEQSQFLCVRWWKERKELTIEIRLNYFESSETAYEIGLAAAGI